MSSVGATQDGYALTWVNGSNDWEAKPVSGAPATGGGFDDEISILWSPGTALTSPNVVTTWAQVEAWIIATKATTFYTRLTVYIDDQIGSVTIPGTVDVDLRSVELRSATGYGSAFVTIADGGRIRNLLQLDNVVIDASPTAVIPIYYDNYITTEIRGEYAGFTLNVGATTSLIDSASGVRFRVNGKARFVNNNVTYALCIGSGLDLTLDSGTCYSLYSNDAAVGIPALLFGGAGQFYFNSENVPFTPQTLHTGTLVASRTIKPTFVIADAFTPTEFVVDGSLGDVFSRLLVAGANICTALTFAEGQTIVVEITGAASTLTFTDTIAWVGGMQPAQPASDTGVYTFVKIGATIHGVMTSATSYAGGIGAAMFSTATGTIDDVTTGTAGAWHWDDNGAALDVTVTGFAGGTDNRILIVYNNATANSQHLILSGGDVGSIAANRIQLPGEASTLSIPASRGVILAYQPALSLWVVVAQTTVPTSTVPVGVFVQAMGDADQAPSAGNISSHDTIRMTGSSQTVSRNLTVTSASDAASYTRDYENAGTTAFDVVVTTGAGTTVSVAPGCKKRIRVDAGGCVDTSELAGPRTSWGTTNSLITMKESVNTTNATATTVITYPIPTGTFVDFQITVIGVRTSGGTAGDCYRADFPVAYQRIAGAAPTIVGAAAIETNKKTNGGGSGYMPAFISPSISGNDLIAQVKGVVSTGIDWSVIVQGQQVS